MATQFEDAFAAAGIDTGKLAKACAGNKPVKPKGKTKTDKNQIAKPAETVKPVTPRKRRAGKADNRSAIEKVLKGKDGTKVAIDKNLTVRVEITKGRDGEEARKIIVVSNEDDEGLGRFVFASELNFEEVFFRPGSSEKLYDQRANLHSILRGLALEAGLVDKVAKKATGISWEERLMAPGAIGLDYVEPVKNTGSPMRVLRQDRVAPHLAEVQVKKLGIAGLFEAPNGRKVWLEGFEFLVEARKVEDAEERRYKVTQADEDRFLGIWVTHANVVRSRTAYLSDKMSDGFSAMKVEIHAILRDAAVDAGLIEGKKALKRDAITDQSLVVSSIKEGLEGVYLVDGIYEDENGNAESAVVLLTKNEKNRLQIVLLSGRGGYFNDKPAETTPGDVVTATEIRAGARISHHDFMKRTRPNWMKSGATAFVGRFADWLEEVIFYVD